MEHRFRLEKYKNPSSKHVCPQCGHKGCFVRYIDIEGKITFPENVGRCDRESHCGYHYTPKMYFNDHPEMKENTKHYKTMPISAVIRKTESEHTSYMPLSIMEKSLCKYEKNNLYLFLSDNLGKEITDRLMNRYKVGTSNHWDGATVFWQVDANNNARAGKVMLYDRQTGHRMKRPFNHVTWAHTLLKMQDYNLRQCLFGEHLLRAEKNKTVAIVESEKTAITASAYLPQYLWLATGGKNGCFNERSMAVLRGRNVIVFPDLGATEDWRKKMETFRKLGIRASIFDYLESVATDNDKAEGYDIADYLLKKPLSTPEDEHIKKGSTSLEEPKGNVLPQPPRKKYRNPECHACEFSHEGINGTYCDKLGRYVEYGKGDCDKDCLQSL